MDRLRFNVGIVALAVILTVACLAPGVAGANIGQHELFRNVFNEPFAPTAAPSAPGSVPGLTASATPSPPVPPLASEPPLLPVPRAVCGPGARKETGIQGRISRADHVSGLAARGLQCNAVLVGKHTQEKAGQDGTIVGTVGGYKVLRYVDHYHHECAFYDTSLLPPSNVGDGNLGVRDLDMSDPSHPALSTVLASPAMSFPHESLILSEKRGLLMAVAGNLSQTVLPGQVDIYDLNATPGLGCKAPLLLSSTPLGIYGHESGIAPDGNTFYASSLSNETVTALDISNPVLPRLIVHQTGIAAHGLSISDDGKTAYVARGQNNNGFEIYDVSSIQNREAFPHMEHVSKLAWNQMSVPQSTSPVFFHGKPFVIESDEFLRNGTDRTGAARIIDISDPRNPFVVSNLRLAVHQEANRIGGKLQDDPGTTANGNNPFSFAQDYTGHFCNVPTRIDPPIVACGMSISGLRVFNIQDPYHPREVAYFTAPVQKRAFPEGSNWAYSQPTFAPERKEVWYSEAYTGFYAVKLTNGAWPDPRVDQRSRELADSVTLTPGGPPAVVTLSGSQVDVAGVGSVRLPRTQRCLSRRALRVHLGRAAAAHVLSLTVRVNRRARRVSFGRRIGVLVNLRGLPAGRVKVQIVLRARTAGRVRTLRVLRTYHTCKKGSHRQHAR